MPGRVNTKRRRCRRLGWGFEGVVPSPKLKLLDQLRHQKRAVGAGWATRSAGQCLFVIPSEENFSTITTAFKPH